MSLTSSITVIGALLSAPDEPPPSPTPPPDAEKPAAKVGATVFRPAAGALPIELTAFGDILYALRDPGSDDFHIGSLEVDIALTLVPYVSAWGAIAYDPDDGGMRLASFTVDSSLWGSDEHAFWKSDVIGSSGLILGKFDVPFGIAYLRYGSPDNRLVTQPSAVGVTHGGWNDIGAQLYGSTGHVNALGYVVNGQGLPELEGGSAHAAVGGRLGVKPVGHLECGCSLELGGSGARSIGPDRRELTLLGADVSATARGLAVSSELIALRYDDGPRVRGFYSQGVYTLDPVFFGGRYAVTTEWRSVTERTVTAAAGLEIFPQGELRVAYERGLEHEAQTLFIQVVGGRSWKPTGLRR